MKINYVILEVADMDRAVAFYRDVVGVPLKFQSPGWTEFATEGATFALHPMENEGSGDGRSRCRHGFAVPDIEAFHQRMIEHGVEVIQQPNSVFGTKVAQYRDPEGQAFSIGEDRSAT